jgi:hypothetical protein
MLAPGLGRATRSTTAAISDARSLRQRLGPLVEEAVAIETLDSESQDYGVSAVTAAAGDAACIERRALGCGKC